MFTEPLPPAAAWRHQEARAGFEVSFFEAIESGHRIEGSTSAVEDGQAWIVDYVIEIDDAWATRRARVSSRSAAAGSRSVTLEADGRGQWRVDGRPVSHLDGCLDVDLESSSMTNTLPAHRMALAVGAGAEAPAAYVRASTLEVVRLGQRYVRLPDVDRQQRYDYTAEVFDFRCELVYDAGGLVVAYPGIAVRAS